MTKTFPVRVQGMRDPRPSLPLTVYVNTTSRSLEPWSIHLSPFFVGPVIVNGNEAKNVENAWQYSKVYHDQVDGKGNPTEDYHTWAESGFKNTKAVRYPRGKNASPLYSLYKGQKLGYIDARKKIYCPLYAKAVVKTQAFKKLAELYNSGVQIVLIDFDGYDHIKKKMTLKEVVNYKARKMGHAFVLAGLLEENLFWKE